MKLVLFGLPYSPNLGDGVIADCMTHALRDLVPGAEVASVDLSGREGFGHVTVRNRSAVLKLLSALPRPARHALVKWRLGRMLDAAAPRWQAAVRDASAVLIGGGQLFSDADLNFPLKIARAAGVAGAAGVPVAIHAVGVSRNWSAEGARLFAKVFAADLRRAAIRDTPSIEAWNAQVGGAAPAPVFARDPGLLAAACYGPVPRQEGWVGLGVTNPALLGYHADAEVAGSGAGFSEALVRAMVAAGQRVLLFCNGAEEDRAALEALADPLADLVAAGQVRIAPVPSRPADLAHLVGGLDGLVAHRLHACILGYAYARPVVGLGWDRKVESFFASVGAGQFCVTDPAASPEAVAERLAQALAEGVDATVHARAVAEARDAVGASLAACGVGTTG